MKIGSCGNEEPGATTDKKKKKKWCVEAVHDGIICNQKIATPRHIRYVCSGL